MPPRRAPSAKRSGSRVSRKGKAVATRPPSSEDDNRMATVRRPRDGPTPPPDADGAEGPIEGDTVDETALISKQRAIGGRKRNAAKVDNLSIVITDQMAALHRELQAFAVECEMGVCAFQLIDPPPTMKWGKHNTRNVNDAATADLLNNLETRGLHNADPDSLIRIGVKASWISCELIRTSVGKTVLELPLFALTAAGREAMKAGLIVPYSGNHRKHALKAHYVLAEKRLKRGENELRRLTPSDDAKPGSEEIKAYESKKEQVDILRSHFAQAALWGAQLYDLGTYFFPKSKAIAN